MENKKIYGMLIFAGLLFLGLKPAQAQEENEAKLLKSTQPIGSSFYRHLAFDFDVDMNRLFRFEKRGFGRAEIVSLVLLSKISGHKLKDYGNRRVKEKVRLNTLATEAGINYPTFYKVVQVIKKAIEKKGDQNLPPPVRYKKAEDIKPEGEPGEPPEETKQNKKKKKENKKELK